MPVRARPAAAFGRCWRERAQSFRRKGVLVALPPSLPSHPQRAFSELLPYGLKRKAFQAEIAPYGIWRRAGAPRFSLRQPSSGNRKDAAPLFLQKPPVFFREKAGGLCLSGTGKAVFFAKRAVWFDKVFQTEFALVLYRLTASPSLAGCKKQNLYLVRCLLFFS